MQNKDTKNKLKERKQNLENGTNDQNKMKIKRSGTHIQQN